MIFVDTNVIMYAVGGSHPLRDEARSVFETALKEGTPLVSSVEALRELMHAYVPARPERRRVDELEGRRSRSADCGSRVSPRTAPRRS